MDVREALKAVEEALGTEWDYHYVPLGLYALAELGTKPGTEYEDFGNSYTHRFLRENGIDPDFFVSEAVRREMREGGYFFKHPDDYTVVFTL